MTRSMTRRGHVQVTVFSERTRIMTPMTLISLKEYWGNNGAHNKGTGAHELI